MIDERIADLDSMTPRRTRLSILISIEGLIFENLGFRVLKVLLTGLPVLLRYMGKKRQYYQILGWVF
jgi:hypothetical protein